MNTAGFAVIFKPVHKPIRMQSQYDPDVVWRNFANSLSMTRNFADSIPDDPAGLNPLDRLRYDYAIEHPEAVRYTWSQIPDPYEIFKNGKIVEQKEKQQSAIAKIFSTEEIRKEEKLQKKKEEDKGPWTISGQETLQFSQLAVANWVKGGENSASLLQDFRFKAIYSKNRTQWESSATHKVGLTYTSALHTRVSDDELNLSSKYGFNAVNKWYYSFLLTFKTQMFRNYSKSDVDKTKPKSTLLSPAYTQLIFGMDYKAKDLSLLLSPYTLNITSVADTADIDQTAYGISENSRATFLNGFSVTLNWKKEITYGINYSTALELFYEYFKKDGNKRLNWENIIDVQINRFLSTRLLLNLRYFDNESDKFQLKENFTIAFKYSF